MKEHQWAEHWVALRDVPSVDSKDSLWAEMRVCQLADWMDDQKADTRAAWKVPHWAEQTVDC